MIVNDWIAEAVEEYENREYATAMSLRGVLVKHSPFNLDVAYMPVPRCETCKHWTRGVIPVLIKPSCGGVCNNTLPVLHPGIGSGEFETAEHFGCVLYEEKS